MPTGTGFTTMDGKNKGIESGNASTTVRLGKQLCEDIGQRLELAEEEKRVLELQKENAALQHLIQNLEQKLIDQQKHVATLKKEHDQ